MSKLRLVFIKEHQASYISHLDMMRTFQRVFPRAGLSIKHSNGFHPHSIHCAAASRGTVERMRDPGL
jgi:uncharacterized protein (DUF2344 family)